MSEHDFRRLDEESGRALDRRMAEKRKQEIHLNDIQKIEQAFADESALSRVERLTPGKREVDKGIQAALVPGGGDWRCVVPEGAVTRSIVWGRIQVAQINPRGDLHDMIEGQIAMGMAATPVMDKALRVISVLAKDPANNDLIVRIARAAIDMVEWPAPAIEECVE
jgi:hypothetical protein